MIARPGAPVQMGGGAAGQGVPRPALPCDVAPARAGGYATEGALAVRDRVLRRPPQRPPHRARAAVQRGLVPGGGEDRDARGAQRPGLRVSPRRVCDDARRRVSGRSRASSALEGIVRILSGGRRRRAPTVHARRPATCAAPSAGPEGCARPTPAARSPLRGTQEAERRDQREAPQPSRLCATRKSCAPGAAVGPGRTGTLPPAQAGRTIPDPSDRSCVSRKGKAGICAGRNDPAERATGAAPGDRSRPRRPGAEGPGHSPTTDQMSPIEMKKPVNSAMSAMPP